MLEKSNQTDGQAELAEELEEKAESVSKFDSLVAKIKERFKDDQAEEEIMPSNKYASFFMRMQLLNPISTYKRGYDIIVQRKEEEEGEEGEEPKLVVREKKFSRRVQFILLVMVFQSIGFSFAITSSVSLPWTFNVVIPFSLDLFPFNLKELVESLIQFIQDLMRPFEPLIDLIEVIIDFVSTLNPALLFSGTIWFFDHLGWVESKDYLDIPDDYNNGSKTSMDIFAYNLEREYPALGEMTVPFLLFLFSVMGFFFLVTKGKKLLFEMMGEKALRKSIKKVKKPLLAYYMNQGVTEFTYVQNRYSRPKLVKIFFIVSIGLGMFTSFAPMFFAFFIVFF